MRILGHEDSNDLSVADWDGNIVWTYAKAGSEEDEDEEPLLSPSKC